MQGHIGSRYSYNHLFNVIITDLVSKPIAAVVKQNIYANNRRTFIAICKPMIAPSYRFCQSGGLFFNPPK